VADVMTDVVASTSPPPGWFSDALDTPVEVSATVVDGITIAWRAWGERNGNGIVLIHGGAGHSRWWDHIGPLLAEGRRVVALDLSGHGDSDRRDRYGWKAWADEVTAVAMDATGAARPVVVGHSLGGLVALEAAALHGAKLNGIVIIDSPVLDPPELRAEREHRATVPLRVYPSKIAAVRSFRTIPPQHTLPYISAHIAQTSAAAVESGWTWKFDPRLFLRPQFTLRTPLACRAAVFRAEFGVLTSQMCVVISEQVGRATPIIEIPACGHHVMLEQPLALVTGLRTLLAQWDRSDPQKGF
jgi:pimeloyl-ACP methyl ester carboxylesterase